MFIWAEWRTLPVFASITAFTFLCFLQITHECGPGSEVSRSKARKPMVLYQRLPDVDEESISGSGMFRKIVTRNSEEFKAFVKNYNKDIVFDGNGESSRLMTSRCSEKLNKLAVLVKREWPSVKLRVIGAYDEHGLHPPYSLHYEGRAVDITTSDRDRSKNGVLGVLAFRAGFDWLYYESNSFIHASVVAENEVSLKYAECFPGSSIVTTAERGKVEMKHLKVGEHVLTYKHTGNIWAPVFTEVLGFLDRETNVTKQFVRLETYSGASIEATKSHLLYSYGTEERMEKSVDESNTANTAEMQHNVQLSSSYPVLDAPVADALHDRSSNRKASFPASLQNCVLSGKIFSNVSASITTPKPSANVPSRQNVMNIVNAKTSSCYGRILDHGLEFKGLTEPTNFIAKSHPTEKHRRSDLQMHAIYAGSLQEGKTIVHVGIDGQLNQETILKMSTVWRQGAYAPLTAEGTLVADDTLVSCYAKMADAKLAHDALSFYRLIAKYAPNYVREAVLGWYVNALIALNSIFGIAELRDI